MWTYFFNGKPPTSWDRVVRPREALQGWLDERPRSRKPNPRDSNRSLLREWHFKRGWTYTLLGPSGEEPLASLECADWDHEGSLLFARAGSLYRQNLGSEAPTAIADLNANTFEEVIAPAEMQTWPVWKPRLRRR